MIYYTQNNIGSTTLLTNKDGNDVGQFLYSPFGEMWVEEASTVDISHITRFFTNQQYDKESGLYYYNARYYDPHLGSFITPDPAFDNLNHYAYTNANPINYIDPTGMYDVDTENKTVTTYSDDTDEQKEEAAKIAEQLEYKLEHKENEKNPFDSTSNIMALYNISPEKLVDNIKNHEASGSGSKSKLDITTNKTKEQRLEYIQKNFDKIQNDKKVLNVLSVFFNKKTASALLGIGVTCLVVAGLIAAWAYLVGGATIISADGDPTNEAKATFRGINQIHHFLTNKSSVFTKTFEKITGKYGLDLDDVWNKDLMDHVGRHANNYHEFMLSKINDIDKIAKGCTQTFLNEFYKVKEYVMNNPEILGKSFWE